MLQPEEEECEISSGESVLDIEVGVAVPNEENAECLCCGEEFLQNTRGELWVECMECNL